MSQPLPSCAAVSGRLEPTALLKVGQHEEIATIVHVIEQTMVATRKINRFEQNEVTDEHDLSLLMARITTQFLDDPVTNESRHISVHSDLGHKVQIDHGLIVGMVRCHVSVQTPADDLMRSNHAERHASGKRCEFCNLNLRNPSQHSRVPESK